MKHGFTLIELLGVIILLAIIAIIAYPIVDMVIANSKEKAYLRSIENIEGAARIYGTINDLGYDTKQKKISFGELISAGLIKDADIKNPKDNSNIEGCILYYWDDATNQYKYKYDDKCELSTDVACFDTEDKTIILDFDVNESACVNFFINVDMSSDTATEFCAGNTVEGLTLKEFITLGIEFGSSSYDELKAEMIDPGVIYNVEIIEGKVITDYKCGIESSTVELNPIIPSIIDEKKVINIGKKAFSSSGLISLVIPDSVTNIGYYAFGDNQLTSIEIPTKILIINKCAFSNNDISNIDLSTANDLWVVDKVSFSGNPITKENFNGIGEFNYEYFIFDYNYMCGEVS